MKNLRTKKLVLFAVTIALLFTNIFAGIAIASTSIQVPSVRVLFDHTSVDNGLVYWFKLSNTGSSPIDLADVSVKFVFHRNGATMESLRSQSDGAPINSSFDSESNTDGDTFCEYELSAESRMLPPGKSTQDLFGNLYKVKIYSTNSSVKLNLDYAYSYQQSIHVSKITTNKKLWRDGQLVEDTTTHENGADNSIVITCKIPVPAPITVPAAISMDLGVSISADKPKYTNNEDITYSVDYWNAYNIDTGKFKIVADIPQYTDVVDLSGGKRVGNTIEWNFDKIGPLFRGKIVYKVKLANFNETEVAVPATARLESTEKFENTGDDSSTIKVLFFTQKTEKGTHIGYMIGYPDGTFRPEKGVTRAEVATVFCRISGKKNPAAVNNAFKDVGDDNWAKGFIEHSTTVMKVFGGYPDGNFQPNRAITRAELAQVVSNYLSSGKPSPLTVYFNDDKDHWAKASIAEAKRNNIVSGYLDGTFKPDNSITRAELVTMVNNLLFRGPFINDVQTWPDVSPSYWAFGQVEEGSTDHMYTRNEKGEEVPAK